MIHHLPPVLILHMKRFYIGIYTVTKDDRQISFPEILHMEPYCTNECIKVIINYIIVWLLSDANQLLYVVLRICKRGHINATNCNFKDA